MKYVFAPDKLRTAMLTRGLTGAALAMLAGVNESVITSARRGLPVQVKSASRIGKALEATEVIDLLDDLKSEVGGKSESPSTSTETATRDDGAP